jgi:hypothetical protein
MNSDARKTFATLMVGLFGLMGFYLGRGWDVATSPVWEVLWPVAMAILIVTSLVVLLWIATGPSK